MKMWFILDDIFIFIEIYGTKAINSIRKNKYNKME